MIDVFLVDSYNWKQYNCDFLQFVLVITHSQALEEGTKVSYPIYVIDNNPSLSSPFILSMDTPFIL